MSKAKCPVRKSVAGLAFACAMGLLSQSAMAFSAEDSGEAFSARAMRSEAARYEHGEGVAKDAEHAVALYCAAARLGDGEAQFDLGYMYAMGRGVPRNDAWAAYFFQAAAEQGIGQAQRMLQAVGEPGLPDCMREEPEPAAVLPAVAPPPMVAIAAPKAILALVHKMAPEYRIDPQLVLAIMKNESNFDSVALSPKNAMGLMQLIPETAARFNVRNPYDPKQNIRGGLAYLRWLLAYFEGDVKLVAAAYNAGEGTVERYRGIPPYLETRAYVRRVLAAVGQAALPFDAAVVRPSPQLRLIQDTALVK